MKIECKYISEIIEILPEESKAKLNDLIIKCIDDNDYIRLIINIEIDLIIKSISKEYLMTVFSWIADKDINNVNDFIKYLITFCGRDFCQSSFQSDCSDDYISYITDEEFINFLSPSELKLDKLKLKSKHKFWTKRINKLGLSKFRGPFKNKDGDSRIPWVTLKSILQNEFVALKYSGTFGEFINDKLGLGYGTSSANSASFISIKYPNTVDIILKKPTFIDGSLYGFPGRFINTVPYYKFHGRTISTNGNLDGFPEAVHTAIEKLSDEFEFDYVGASKAVIEDTNINKAAYLRFNTAISYHV